jgi:hypothetical protein
LNYRSEDHMPNLTIVPRGASREDDVIEDFCSGCGHVDAHTPHCPRGGRTLTVVPSGFEVDTATEPTTLAGAWHLAKMSLRPGMVLVGVEVSAWTDTSTTWVAAASTLADWAVGSATINGEGSTEVAALVDLANRLWTTGRPN